MASTLSPSYVPPLKNLKDPIFEFIERVAQASPLNTWWIDPTTGRIRSRGSNLDPLGFLHAQIFDRYSRMDEFVDHGYALGLPREASVILAMASDNMLKGADTLLLNEVRRHLVARLINNTPTATAEEEK